MQSVLNRGFEDLLYGPLPIKIEPYEEGVVPSKKYTGEYKFGGYRINAGDRVRWTTPTPPPSDIFLLTEDEKDRILDVYIYIEPVFLRNYIFYPSGQPQVMFRSGGYSVTVRADTGDDFGFFRYIKNIIFTPKVDVSFGSYNHTNVDLRTFVKFKYAEYKVELERDEKRVEKIIREKIGKRVVMPCFTMHTKIEELFSLYKMKPVKVVEEVKV